MSADAFSAKLGNELIDIVMETKLLDFNLDKSCYIGIGGKAAKEEIRNSFEAEHLYLSGKPKKEATAEKYLGDYISSEGLGDSIIVTINNRSKKVTIVLLEIRAVIEDCRALVNGGIVTGIEIWETAVISYLLNNSETWNYGPSKAMVMLDDLQN